MKDPNPQPEPPEAGGDADGGKLEPDSPWQRILDAAACNRGIRLSADEVESLVMDDSLLTLAVNDTFRQVLGDGEAPENADEIEGKLRSGSITTAQARRALRRAMK